jgi:hypothetical protein
MGRFTAENAEMGKLLLRGFDDIMERLSLGR